MPNKDGTWPTGQGPMTGRGMGNCNSQSSSNMLWKFFGGFGRRFGKGWRWNWQWMWRWRMWGWRGNWRWFGRWFNN